ncbi:MAG: C39 family peptidase [Thermoleophilia bacterium]
MTERLTRSIGLALLVVLVLVVLSAVAGGALLLDQRRAGAEPIPSAGGEPLDISPLTGVPYYLQNDPKWASETLGGSNQSLGAAGCTVSCIAMGVSALGPSMDPAEVSAGLKQAGGFTDSGQVIWASVGDITDGAVRIELPEPGYEVIDAELTDGRPVIVKIMLGETVPHWVLIVGKQGQEYLAMDPLDRDKELVRLSDRSAAIRAVRVFRPS